MPREVLKMGTSNIYPICGSFGILSETDTKAIVLNTSSSK
jgi:hypothetical protein